MERQIIIVAGGQGRRMNAQQPKQFLPLCGKPLLMRTMERFHDFDADMPITLVLPQQHFDTWKTLCREYNFDIPHRVVAGGEERFFSVKNALATIPNGVVVGIHDGVRPFASNKTIEQAFVHADTEGCAVPAMPAKESVRLADGDNSAPLDRSKVMLVQTPQCFRSEIIKAAYNTDYSLLFTDDATVVETVLKKRIAITPGNAENIKITTPFDLEMAEIIYKNKH
ncbi:MAG: 2-C-methyl-D-erythritol 4-phosphate cytidylyltransferase [Bacteroidales bacterium]|nr:2-C-methyl-D-erythritol 4-phosphate cytidylyltransferase [Bacteroidales bacterium]MBR5028419.1 2-C-methyl-D-erythritol 4-phosphate cytidylyltransferase [Bacteroidales bacterium]